MSTGPTEDQWHKMIDKEMSRPIPLVGADLTNHDWVYWRPWGVMYVTPGMHTAARSTLLAFHYGLDNYLDLARTRGEMSHNKIFALADAFLTELEGTAFLSSMSDTILAGKREHLNAQERQVFRRSGFDIRYLEDRE